MLDFTAAHPSLKLGSFVKVTNLRNGKTVVVRINDRGPVVDGRIIDLSYNAARALDFQERGVQRVRLDRISPRIPAELPAIGRGAAATRSQSELKPIHSATKLSKTQPRNKGPKKWTRASV